MIYLSICLLTLIGLRRCGKSCRVRKADNSGTKHESFTAEEEDLIIKMHAAMGSRLCTLLYRKLIEKISVDSLRFRRS